MSLKTKHLNVNTTYFVTFTCYNWLPLFEITKLYEDIYRWFDKLTENGNYILGYVIMLNHIHLLIRLGPQSKTINQIVSEGKRFRAYEIVKRLKNLQQHELLIRLSGALTLKEKSKGSNHKIFIESFDCKECFTSEFVQQKLRYIHHNPVKSGLVEYAEQFIHSSANFYSSGQNGIYRVTSYLNFFSVPIGK